MLEDLMATPSLRVAIAVLATLLFVLTVRLIAPLMVPSKSPAMDVMIGTDPQTLVVVVHGFGGRSRPGLIELARTAFPGAHVIAPAYSLSRLQAFSNQSPYELADTLETSIDAAFNTHHYARIILIGHSLGGELLRKAFLWGAGEEDDRPGVRRGEHKWVDKVTRFVSLASINRGWSIDPAPRNMLWHRRAQYQLGLWIAKFTGTGGLMLAVRRGAPFVADSRVQWVRLARRSQGASLPPVIHLLGTRDDIATSEDTKDAQVAKDFKFKSLPNTDHADIATSLAQELGPNGPLTSRARTILDYVTRPLDQLSFDAPDPLKENPDITRIVFILHGIRDQDTWGLQLQQQISAESGSGSNTVVVVPKYGYFPMAPFLLWSDRQQKVRWFMDVYTEELARYPKAKSFDFIGHSNGTYILASALQRYRTLKVDDVYFAGSVVPQSYRWAELVGKERVRSVTNVVATKDWVVALFPRLYEQIAEWRGTASEPGALDIGAAGFRGFHDAGQPASGVRDITYADGSHSAGVDLLVEDKRRALVRFGRHGLDGEQKQLFEKAFRTTATRKGFWAGLWDQLSNVCWLAWLVLAAVVVGVGLVAWRGGWGWALLYAAIILGILNSF